MAAAILTWQKHLRSLFAHTTTKYDFSYGNNYTLHVWAKQNRFDQFWM
jgi:hypothetical protein